MVRSLLENRLNEVWLEGEISNLRPAPSGHVYFSLKDEHAQVSAVLFKGQAAGLSLKPADGMKVRVRAQVTLYEAGGRYQVQCRHMEEAGLGDLHRAFEALKKKLQAEGLFEPGRKKALPMLPQCIGVVTSPTGAAVRDILQVIERRFPNLQVLLAPVRVQGKGAAEEIARAIQLLNRSRRIEVMIVGRGGGSLEDLWAFNEEIVARAIAASRIPVISAVGHETDFTISDMVADLRAPTPSAAAELVVGRKEDFEAGLERYRQRMTAGLERVLFRKRHRVQDLSGRMERRMAAGIRQLQQKLDEQSRCLERGACDQVAALRERVQHMENRLQAASPRARLRGYAQTTEQYRARLLRLTERKVTETGMILTQRRERLEVMMRQDWKGRSDHLQRALGVLHAMNPYAVLERGYSLTLKADGSVVKAAGQLKAGDPVTTRLSKGLIHSTVTETKETHE